MPPAKTSRKKGTVEQPAKRLEDIFATEIKMRRSAVNAAMRNLTAYTKRITATRAPAAAAEDPMAARRAQIELQLMADNTQSLTGELQKAVMRLNHAHLHMVAALWSAEDRKKAWRFVEDPQNPTASRFVEVPRASAAQPVLDRKRISLARTAAASSNPLA